MIRITEVRFDPGDSPRVLAYAHATFERDLVVHDLRLVKLEQEGGGYRVFLAFPSLQRKFACPTCGGKNPFSNRYCGKCGARFDGERLLEESPGGSHHDVVHPIKTSVREHITREILKRFQDQFPGALGE